MLDPVLKGSAAGTQPAAPQAAAPRRHPYALAAGALVLLALIWGYTWPVMKVMLTYAEPFPYAAMRTFTAGIILVLFLPVFRRPMRPKAVGMTALLGVLQTAGFLGPHDLGSPGRRSRKDGDTHLHHAVLAAAYGLGLSGGEAQRIPMGRGRSGARRAYPRPGPLGYEGRIEPVSRIGGALCWAASAIVAKLLRKRHEVDLLSLTAWQLLLGSIPLVIVAAATWSPPVWSGTFIAGLAFTVLAGNCLAWILWLYILSALPAGTAGLGMLLTPVIGIIASWIQLGERPGGIEGLGMLLIVSALLLTVAAEIVRGRRRRSLQGR